MKKARERSGFIIACKTLTPPIDELGCECEPSYSLIRYIDSLRMVRVEEVTIGDFENLSLLIKELTEYANKIKEGGTV